MIGAGAVAVLYNLGINRRRRNDDLAKEIAVELYVSLTATLQNNLELSARCQRASQFIAEMLAPTSGNSLGTE